MDHCETTHFKALDHGEKKQNLFKTSLSTLDIFSLIASGKSHKKWAKLQINGILLPKLFWPAVRKKCSSDREKLLKFEAEGREFAKILRSLEQFIQTVKGYNNFW